MKLLRSQSRFQVTSFSIYNNEMHSVITIKVLQCKMLQLLKWVKLLIINMLITLINYIEINTIIIRSIRLNNWTFTKYVDRVFIEIII